jgi:hypothetical protein
MPKSAAQIRAEAGRNLQKGRRNAPRDPSTGRYVSIDQVIAKAQAWYGQNGKASPQQANNDLPPAATFAKTAEELGIETPKEFARELRTMVKETPGALRDVIEMNAKRVAKIAVANVLTTAPIHNAGAHKGIDWTVYDQDGDQWGEVFYNPRKHRGAYLGNLLEFGGPGINGDPSPAHYDLANALRANINQLVKDSADVGQAIIETDWSNDPGIRKRWKSRADWEAG